MRGIARLQLHRIPEMRKRLGFLYWLFTPGFTLCSWADIFPFGRVVLRVADVGFEVQAIDIDHGAVAVEGRVGDGSHTSRTDSRNPGARADTQVAPKNDC